MLQNTRPVKGIETILLQIGYTRNHNYSYKTPDPLRGLRLIIYNHFFLLLMLLQNTRPVKGIETYHSLLSSHRYWKSYKTPDPLRGLRLFLLPLLHSLLRYKTPDPLRGLRLNFTLFWLIHFNYMLQNTRPVKGRRAINKTTTACRF